MNDEEEIQQSLGVSFSLAILLTSTCIQTPCFSQISATAFKSSHDPRTVDPVVAITKAGIFPCSKIENAISEFSKCVYSLLNSYLRWDVKYTFEHTQWVLMSHRYIGGNSGETPLSSGKNLSYPCSKWLRNLQTYFSFHEVKFSWSSFQGLIEGWIFDRDTSAKITCSWIKWLRNRKVP